MLVKNPCYCITPQPEVGANGCAVVDLLKSARGVGLIEAARAAIRLLPRSEHEPGYDIASLDGTGRESSRVDVFDRRWEGEASIYVPTRSNGADHAGFPSLHENLPKHAKGPATKHDIVIHETKHVAPRGLRRLVPSDWHASVHLELEDERVRRRVNVCRRDAVENDDELASQAVQRIVQSGGKGGKIRWRVTLPHRYANRHIRRRMRGECSFRRGRWFQV